MSTTIALERMEGLQEILPKGSRAEMSCKPSCNSKAAVLLIYFLLEYLCLFTCVVLSYLSICKSLFEFF